MGDQLTFIALPWLVLKLTGDALVMGTVLAVAAVPRALFMLVGGAVTDRYSPRLVLLASNAVRMALVATLAVLTFGETIAVWTIYAIALLFGLADAFMFPASSAFPPRLLPRERLAAGNGLIQGTAQVTLVLGPLLAGLLIAGLGGAPEGGLADARGLALVFALDAVSFLVPIGILLVIRDEFPPPDAEREPIWPALLSGLRYLWGDPPLRTLALMLAALSLFFRGPFFVGVPAFADAYLGDGAAGFGTIMAALGVGSIVGTIIASSTRHPPPERAGVLLLIDFFSFGVIMAFMTVFPNTWLIASAVAVAGILDGYITILLITWVQMRVPSERLGRVMSVVMLASQGLFPISAALAGAVAGWNLAGMLVGASVIMVAVTVVGFAVRPVRRLGHV